MELIDAIKTRRSIRKFKPTKIPAELVDEIIDAGQWAPSACNKQLWKFIVIEKDEIKKELVKKAGSIALIEKAPIVIATLYQKDFSLSKNAFLQSAAAAVQNMLLTAHSKGLGGVWLCAIGNPQKIKAILSVPSSYELISFVALGYPDIHPDPPQRKKINAIRALNSFNFARENTYPATYNPSKWNLAQIIRYREDAMRATAPDSEAYPYGTPAEFEKETAVLANWVQAEPKFLEIFPFAGTHTLSLLKKSPHYHIYELSKGPLSFVEARVKNCGPEKCQIHSTNGKYDQFPYPDKSFEQIGCFQKLETFPHPHALKEISRVLKTNGHFILTFRNKSSWYHPYYWLIYRLFRGEQPNLKFKRGEVWNYGPFKPLSFFRVKRLLKKHGFRIKEIKGIGLYPNNTRIQAKGLARFCKLILLKCQKT